MIEPSDNYMFEVEKFRYATQYKGQDKVSLFNKAYNKWNENTFLNKVHKHNIQSNTSREGRKLDLAANFKRFRIDTT